jgi:hypothetical protein
VDNLIERKKNIQKQKHENKIMKSQREEMRHNRNMIAVIQNLNDKAAKNEEKVFQKYMTFYFLKKGKEKQLKLKKSQTEHKYLEKAEKIDEIERLAEQKTKDLIKKFDNIEQRKKEILKHKNDNIKMFNQKRKEYYSICLQKRKNMLKELSEIRMDILDYQTCVLQRNINKLKLINLKKTQSTEKTINDQLNFKKNIKPFYKKLENIKSESIMRKSISDRRKIFLQKKKKDAEKKKIEEEEKLINLNLK